MDTAHTNHTPSVSAADGHPHKSKSSSRGGGCTLGEEAAVLAPLMSRWRAAVTPLHDYDLAGAFILSSLALRRPKAFLSSRLKPAVTCEGELCKASLPIGQFEGLLELMGYDFIKRKCCSPTATSTSTSCHIDEDPRDIPIAVIFNRCRLTGVKANADDYVNRSVVLWAQGLLPFQLMFSIPSPLEVLSMQAAGRRVVTLFTSQEQLASQHTARLHYMSGAKLHSRDALCFLLHDMKHMQHFTDSSIHAEQVGFFRQFIALPKHAFPGSVSDAELASGQKLRSVFVDHFGYDQQLWREIEYLISDMNCFSTHLLQYLVAKLLEADMRRSAQQRDQAAVRRDAAAGSSLELLLQWLGIGSGSCVLKLLLHGQRLAEGDDGRVLPQREGEKVDKEEGMEYKGGMLSMSQGEEVREIFRRAAEYCN